MYGDPCQSPAGWKTYNTEEECSGASSCPAPVAHEPGTGCLTVEVWAKDPATGACCTYGDPCSAPKDWKLYYNGADCDAGK
jgi:hypothetical protein